MSGCLCAGERAYGKRQKLDWQTVDASRLTCRLHLYATRFVHLTERASKRESERASERASKSARERERGRERGREGEREGDIPDFSRSSTCRSDGGSAPPRVCDAAAKRASFPFTYRCKLMKAPRLPPGGAAEQVWGARRIASSDLAR